MDLSSFARSDQLRGIVYPNGPKTLFFTDFLSAFTASGVKHGVQPVIQPLVCCSLSVKSEFKLSDGEYLNE
ncbi:hypothetical protein ACS86_14070 [Vibrio alginolyticus]|nr:hypothetical protein ACS86_14070 [Vibrio alginolyticus]